MQVGSRTRQHVQQAAEAIRQAAAQPTQTQPAAQSPYTADRSLLSEMSPQQVEALRQDQFEHRSTPPPSRPAGGPSAPRPQRSR